MLDNISLFLPFFLPSFLPSFSYIRSFHTLPFPSPFSLLPFLHDPPPPLPPSPPRAAQLPRYATALREQQSLDGEFLCRLKEKVGPFIALLGREKRGGKE
jgi:hypothetical protein